MNLSQILSDANVKSTINNHAGLYLLTNIHHPGYFKIGKTSNFIPRFLMYASSSPTLDDIVVHSVVFKKNQVNALNNDDSKVKSYLTTVENRLIDELKTHPKLKRFRSEWFEGDYKIAQSLMKDLHFGLHGQKPDGYNLPFYHLTDKKVTKISRPLVRTRASIQPSLPVSPSKPHLGRSASHQALVNRIQLYDSGQL